MRFLSVAIVLISTSLFAADNPFLGTWKLNAAKSKSSPMPVAQGMTVKFEPDGEKVRRTVTGVDGEGKPIMQGGPEALRLAGVTTLKQADQHLEKKFLPWWNRTLKVLAASPADAHRPLGAGHHLASSLSQVESRQVANDYTIRYGDRAERHTAGAPRWPVRVELRLDGSLAVCGLARSGSR